MYPQASKCEHFTHKIFAETQAFLVSTFVSHCFIKNHGMAHGCIQGKWETHTMKEITILADIV